MSAADGGRAPGAPLMISVCVPAYNRAAELPALLESVFTQDYPHYEVVICEDGSPEREQIRAVVARYAERHPGRLRYVENAETLGYDGNFREMLRRARGDYCFILGNDDLAAPGALRLTAEALTRSPGVGVVLRSFARFTDTPEHLYTVSRYYRDELRFPPGPDTVALFYRRLVIMSGLVFHRAAALEYETERFDGTLFYQLHLAAHILMHRPGLFVPDVLAYYRTGNTSDFGMSRHERGRFTPRSFPPGASVRFLEAHLDIAGAVDEAYGTDVRARVHRDLGRHMYPTFAQHADESPREYLALYRSLWRLGFWRYPLFHAYAAAVAVLGSRRTDAALHAVRRRLGYTPSFGERPRRAVVVRSAPA